MKFPLGDEHRNRAQCRYRYGLVPDTIIEVTPSPRGFAGNLGPVETVIVIQCLEQWIVVIRRQEQTCFHMVQENMLVVVAWAGIVRVSDQAGCVTFLTELRPAVGSRNNVTDSRIPAPQQESPTCI